MKESQISDALRESMNAVRLSPALRAKALCAMRGSEERRPKMKRKFSAALAFALVEPLPEPDALAPLDSPALPVELLCAPLSPAACAARAAAAVVMVSSPLLATAGVLADSLLSPVT